MLTDSNIDKLEAWEAIAQEAGITMTQLAVGWVAKNPLVSTVLCGATSPEQLKDGAKVSDLPGYTPEELRRADDVHPGDFQAA